MDLQKFKETGILDISPEDANDPGTMLVVNNLLKSDELEIWLNDIEQLNIVKR